MTTMEVTDVQTTPTLVDVRPLRAQLDGDIVTPEDEGWDEARLAWNLAIDQRPAAVALTESAADVAAVVRFAGENGLRVAPQGTGHNAAALAAAAGSLEDAILLRTVRILGV